MELCAAEFSSVSASSGVAEETDAGVAFPVALSAGEDGRRSASSVSSCVTLSPLPAASGSLQRERETFLHFLFPGGPVCGGCFLGVGVDAQSVEVALADFFFGRLIGSPPGFSEVQVLHKSKYKYNKHLTKTVTNINHIKNI